MKIPFIVILMVVCVSGICQSGKRTYDTLPNLPEHYTKRLALFKAEPIKSGRIIMVGNSITEGGDWKKLFQDSTVINRGISGDVTFGVLNRLQEIIDRKPRKIFLLIGINDLSRNTPDEVIQENIFNIVTKLKSRLPKTTVYLQSILPTNESFKNLNKNFVGKGEHITTINAQLKKYATKLKYNYIDLHSRFVDSEGRMEAKYSGDGLHLNAAGYAHWIEILKEEKIL
ncbi:MAG: sialate O-acetylesterase [Bacteroidetes bacterium]|nr:sialate O-acetylesterase [Bacteroidota bacterium]